MQPEEHTQRTEEGGGEGALPSRSGSGRDAASPDTGTAPGSASKKHRWLWLILLLVLLLLAVLAGWLWWTARDKPAGGHGAPASSAPAADSPADDEEDAAAACADGLTRYENTSLDIAFCYPAAWGAVSAHDATFEAADAGTRWRLSFAAKEQVHVGLVSADWSTTVPRDGVCVDPAAQTVPDDGPFSTAWQTDGSPASSATRGIAETPGSYLLVERVDNLLGNGVCLEGYRYLSGTPASLYPHAAASYAAEFSGAIMTPDQHIAAPTTLVPSADRDAFAAMVQSMVQL